MLKFTERPKTPGMTSKGNKLFAGDFRANLDETNINVSFYKEMELEMDCLTSRIL